MLDFFPSFISSIFLEPLFLNSRLFFFSFRLFPMVSLHSLPSLSKRGKLTADRRFEIPNVTSSSSSNSTDHPKLLAHLKPSIRWLIHPSCMTLSRTRRPMTPPTYIRQSTLQRANERRPIPALPAVPALSALSALPAPPTLRCCSLPTSGPSICTLDWLGASAGSPSRLDSTLNCNRGNQGPLHTAAPAGRWNGVEMRGAVSRAVLGLAPLPSLSP